MGGWIRGVDSTTVGFPPAHVKTRRQYTPTTRPGEHAAQKQEKAVPRLSQPSCQKTQEAMNDADLFALSAKQQRFLDAIREVGTLRKAAAAASIGRATVSKWLSENINGFRAAFDEAKEDFADKMEGIMFDRIAEMKVGHNPTLLIFALKALRPLKYRELSTIPNDQARQVLEALEKLSGAKAVLASDKSDSQLTALEQVERLLKENNAS